MRIGSRYELLARIGQGGMGIVWRAHDELLDRDVAIKEVLLPPELAEAERDERYARTIREARSAARLNHPGVITVYDVIEEDGRPWIVMELIGAPSLQSVINAEGRLAPQRVAEFGRQMVAALRAAHAAGIVHRDIKPSNVLVAAADRVVITDFGIAALEGDATLTRTGAMIGSPAYIAPERVRGDTAGPPADLWSLGITLFAAVQGRSPFERSGTVPTLAAILSEEVPAAPNAGPLAPTLEGLLRKDPADRITAAEANRLLTRAAHPEPATVADSPTPHLGTAAPPSQADRPAPQEQPPPSGRPAPGHRPVSPARAAPPDREAPPDMPAAAERPAQFDQPAPGHQAASAPAGPRDRPEPAGRPEPGGDAGASDRGTPRGRPAAQAAQAASYDQAGASGAGQGAAPGQPMPDAAGVPAPGRHMAPGGGAPPGQFGTAAQAQAQVQAPAGTRRSVALVAVSALAGALVVTALVVVWLLGRTSAGNDAAGPPPSGAQPGAGNSSAPAAGGSGSPPATGIPADWAMRHEAGFSVAVPAAWARQERNGSVLYQDATTRFLLQVGPVAWDGDSQARETVAGLAREFRAFRESSVTQVTFRGGQAVDIRFAYDRSTGVERGHIRLFHVGPSSYMIFLRMPAELWSQAPSYLDPIFNSFRPA